MRIDVAFLPRDAEPEILRNRAVVVFDVLRATTSMTAALALHASEIRIFADIESVRKAAMESALAPRPLLCGEEKCLRPQGFDLGNSPGAFDGSVSSRTLYMSTTNGTRAIIAARTAKLLLVGALVNATAIARAVKSSGLDVTLLCAGTDGRVSLEDAIGAGAVIEALRRMGPVDDESDAANMAFRLFEGAKNDLPHALSTGAGGRHILGARLGADIEFAARLDRFEDVVGRVDAAVVRRME
jgi:2-phosphosulfolactate phosphatase